MPRAEAGRCSLGRGRGAKEDHSAFIPSDCAAGTHWCICAPATTSEVPGLRRAPQAAQGLVESDHSALRFSESAELAVDHSRRTVGEGYEALKITQARTQQLPRRSPTSLLVCLACLKGSVEAMHPVTEVAALLLLRII